MCFLILEPTGRTPAARLSVMQCKKIGRRGKTLGKAIEVKNLSTARGLQWSQESCSEHAPTSQSFALPDTPGTPAQQTTISSKYIPGTQLVFQLGA